MTDPLLPSGGSRTQTGRKAVAFTCAKPVHVSLLGTVGEGQVPGLPCCPFQSPVHIRTEKTEIFPDDLQIEASFGKVALEGEVKRHPLGMKPLTKGGKMHPYIEKHGTHAMDTVQMDCDKGSWLAIRHGQKHFKGELQQFHVHFPSEHKLDGRKYDGEIHFVFKDKDGHIGVLGVLVEEGTQRNPVFDAMFARIKNHEFSKPQDALPETLEALCTKKSFDKLIPKQNKVFYTTGSLTVPNEKGRYGKDVQWVVMETPIKATRDQLAAYAQVIGSENDRPLQPLRGRVIYRGDMVVSKIDMSFAEKARRDAESTGMYAGAPGLTT